ncbi:MAG TPA: hypothetical protein PKM21_10420 [Anaerolineales bacterium]|nr:hypothetical protein [Anaerolineales bacterium]
MDYIEVLKRAWQIIWKHKVLWLFGILASCGQAGNSASGGSSAGSHSSSGGSGGSFPPSISHWFDQVEPGTWILIAVGIFLFVIILILLSLVLGSIGRIALVRGAQQAEKGAERLAFSELFSGSLPYFWRVLGLVLLVGVSFLLAVTVVGIPLAIVTCGLGALVIVVAGFLMPILVQQAVIALVLEDLDIITACKRSWQLFRQHPDKFIIMGLVLNLGIALVAGLVIALPLILVAVPALVGVIAGTEQGIMNGLVVAGVCLAAYLPVALFLNGVVTSYTHTAWTLTYLRLTEVPAN